ncbi:hypothetical protein [Rhodanobacter umsongensis]
MSSEFSIPADVYSSFQSSASSDISDIATPLVEVKGWIRFIAIAQIAISVLYILVSLVVALRGIGAFGIGMVVALLPIYLSVLMLQTVTAAERAYARGDASTLKLALSKVKTYFLIQAIVTMAGFIFAIVFTILAANLALALYGIRHLPH